MLPAELNAEVFSKYPPEARAVAVRHVALFQQLPLAFLPLLLRELITYDWKFPAERQELDQQLKFLDGQAPAQLSAAMAPFKDLKLSRQLEAVDWVNVPAQFSEELSAYLWSTHQIDSFRKASIDYVHNLNLAQATTAPPVARLSLVLVGKGSTPPHPALFRRMKPYGAYFSNIEPRDGVDAFFSMLQRRAATHPAPFAHWYIDGATLQTHHDQWTCVSYDSLNPVREALLAKMSKVMAPGGGGPELLRSELQRMRPEDVGFTAGGNAILNRFQLSLLTEGSGTQIFSTTFVQWAAREALRRAQPWTLLIRYAPRQKNASIGEEPKTLDPEGALVDADMGAYYTWINQQRLASSSGSGFVAWYEGHNQAVAVGPHFHAGSEEKSATTLKQILDSFS